MYTIREISYLSADYEEMLRIREHNLLIPLGLQMSAFYTKNDKHCTLLGIYQEHNMVGCCMIEHLNMTSCQLRQMVIIASLRKKGLGKTLLQYAEKYCLVKLKAKELVFDARKEAVAFYLQNGYTIQSKEYLKVGIPHFKMSKKLT